jgi:putative PIN family toxin of toxin-antitoxin system
MRVLIDTNVLVSAAYLSGSVPFRAFAKAVNPPHQGLICKQSLIELRRVWEKKFPDRADALERFISVMLASVELVAVPSDALPEEAKVRDTDDRTILRAARKARADILLTGDKDFLESGITDPNIMTASEFLKAAV